MPKKLTLEVMQALAASRGGACLSDAYRGADKKLLWRCARGHQWQALPHSVRQGHWCGRCALERRRKSLAELAQLAARRRGRLVSSGYINSQTHVRWRCHVGHEWNAIPNSIRRGTWCPHCRAAGPRGQGGGGKYSRPA